MDAITYGQLILTLGDTALSVRNLIIREEPGEHGILSATVAAEEGAKDFLLYEERGSVAVYAVVEKKRKPLFYGIVTQLKVKTNGNQCVIDMEAVTASYQMDLVAKNRSFQDTAMTSRQLIEKVMEPYRQQSHVFFAIPDEELGQIMVQYQETDWAFLNRILSKYGAKAYVDSTTPGICIRAGLMDLEEDADWDSLPFTVSRSMSPTCAEGTLKGQLCYRLEAYDLIPLGEKVSFRDHELYIGRIERNISQGLLSSSYSLYFPEGLRACRYNNPFLSGVSINGAVTSVKRDRIQARLETDAPGKCRRKYFFPFSTVAASPDGSGWYCMPQKGDRVRIFFPTDDEKEGYAITNIQGESAPASDSSMGNPDAKDITTPDGKAVRFVEGGIQLSVGDEKGIITLTNDGKAEIRTDEDIEIGAAETLYFTTEGELSVIAGTQIQITNDAGGSIRMSNDTVEIQAAVIRNN